MTRKIGNTVNYKDPRTDFRRSRMTPQSDVPVLPTASQPPSRPEYKSEEEESSSEDDSSVGSLADFVTNDNEESESEEERVPEPPREKRRRIEVEPSDSESDYASDEVPSDVEPPRNAAMAGKYAVRARPRPPVERYWDARNHEAACRREGFVLPKSSRAPQAQRPSQYERYAGAAGGGAAGGRASAGGGARAPSKRTRPYACDVHSINGSAPQESVYPQVNSRAIY